jgi:hypothetical protein
VSGAQPEALIHGGIMSFHNIYWNKESRLIHLTQEQLNNKIEHYNEIGHVPNSKTIRMEWLEDGAYSVDTFGQNIVLYCRENGELIRYCAPVDADKLNSRSNGHGGVYAYNLINKMFSNIYGLSIVSAFGRCEKSFKRFVPAPILWLNEKHKYKVIHNVYKADVSSAFPYELSKPLPDYHTYEIVKGRKEPNKKFKFAFYAKSNHLAIYNEFDTHYNKEKFIVDGRFPAKNVKDDEEETILMEASDYSFAPICEHFYKLREKNKESKQLINSAIGYMQSQRIWKGNYFLGHIPAIVIARSNQRMIDYCQELVNNGNHILMVATDSIAWCGKPFAKTDLFKKLGAFYLEYEKCQMKYYNFGQYGICKDGEFYLVKHQGIDGREVDNLKIGSFSELDSLFFEHNKAVVFNTKAKMFEERRIL